MTHPLIKYSLPTAVLFGLCGFFVGSTMEHVGASRGATLNPRQAFLSSSEDPVDYTKLARVCLAASDSASGRRLRANSGASRPGIATTEVEPSILAEPGDDRVVEDKAALDQVMSVSLEQGVWSRAAAIRARYILRRLPESDVADFESLLKTTVDRGDMRVVPGAWVPQTIN